MKRVEFKLGMPGVNSWNGRWSGEGRNYTITKTLTDRASIALLGAATSKAWIYRWDDGWCASITARVVPKGDRLAKSDGFCGYEWMVRNILDHGDPRHSDEMAAAKRPVIRVTTSDHTYRFEKKP